MTHPRRTIRRAFTLVEAITAITIISVIGLLSTFVLAEAIDSYADASQRGSLHLELSVALDQVTRELRAIPLDTSGSTPVPDIASISTASINFGSAGSLSLSGTDLVLARSGELPATILTDVVALEIEAFDETSGTLPLPISNGSCDPVRRLSISITMNRADLVESLQSRVFIRSMILETSP